MLLKTVVVWMALLLAVVAGQRGVNTSPWRWMPSGIDTPPEYADPDSQGYRYCAYWRLADGTTLYSTCDPFKFRRCGKYLGYEYKCCPGFKKIDPMIFPAYANGNPKCARVISQWDFCPNVLGNTRGYNYFAEHLNFGSFIEKEPFATFTIFAPHVASQGELRNIYDTHKGKGLNNPILYHVVKNRNYAKDLKNNQELISIYKDYPLKVTKYSYGVICIECVEIMEADVECKSGLIHFLRRPLSPRTGLGFDRSSVLKAMQTDPRLQAFAADLPADLRTALGDVNSGIWYTVFPPLKDEWNKIKSKYRGGDLAAIVRYHVVPKLYCSAAMIRHIRRVRTLANEDIGIDCTTEKNYELTWITDQCGNKREVMDVDMMARNGVIHPIDRPLIPLQVKQWADLKECGDSWQVTKFLEFTKGCDLKMKAGKKYTILLPLDYAFTWWESYAKFKPEYSRFMSDAEYRCRVARYHIVEYNPELEKIGYMWHHQKGYRTNNGDLLYETDYFLKDKYKSELYFHYSSVVGFDSFRFNGGSIFRIKRINVIPEKLIIDILREHKRTTITYGQVKVAKFNMTVFRPNRPLNLFLATVDSGWKDSRDGAMLKEFNIYKGELLTKFLLIHHVPMYLWGGDIGYFKKNSVHRFMSSAGLELIFWMDGGGVMRIGYEGLAKEKWAEVIEFNLHATDGIVWLLKNFLICPNNICPLMIPDNDYYDVYVSSCMYMKLGGANRKRAYKKKPLEVSYKYPNQCVWFKQPTYEVKKMIRVKP